MQTPATPEQHQAAISALQRRARIGLLFTANTGGTELQYALWRGYAKALLDVQNGAGARLATKDLPVASQEQPTGFDAAWAGLPANAERLPLADMKQCLLARGIQWPGNSVADLQLNGVEQLEHGAGTTDQPHHKHAADGLVGNDAASFHQGASIAHEGGAA